MADEPNKIATHASNTNPLQTTNGSQLPVPQEPLPESVVSRERPSDDVVGAILNNSSSTVVHANPPPTPTETISPPPQRDTELKKKNPIGIIIGLMLLFAAVATGAYFVAKPQSIGDLRGQASGTMYFYNTQTSSCQSTTAHTSLQSCAANLTLTWPTKFGGTCYSSLESCTAANGGGGGGGGGTNCTQIAGTCLNSTGTCVSYTNGCQRLEVCKDPIATCVLPTPTQGSGNSLCQKKAYFDTVATNANGDNTGTCKLTTKTFDANLVACDGSGQTCNQYLEQLPSEPGISKVYDGCFTDLASCQKPRGETSSFRFFYDTVAKKCLSTNHRYNSQDIDVDDVNRYSCVKSLEMYQPNAKKVCYRSKPTCVSDNSLPTQAPNTPICTNIKVYKGSVQTTPSTLLPGDIVTIALVGTGNPSQARFRVNGAQIAGDTDTDPNWTTTATKNESGEYFISYTIPTGVTTFLFEGETFAAGAWR